MGMGNVLLRDEGFGIHVIGALGKIPLPVGVELLDGGTGGLGLLAWMEARKKIILIDAIDAKEKPGTLFRMPLREGNRMFNKHSHSMHEQSLGHIIEAALLLEMKIPEISLIGIQPGRIDTGTDLSPVIEKKIPEVIVLVKMEIDGFFQQEKTKRGDPVSAGKRKRSGI